MEKTEEKMEELEEPVIIVSDVHLGGEKSNYLDFRDFLKRVNMLNANEMSLECNGGEVKIRKPGTIVLLGDILELWDPRKDNRDYVIKDVLTPISILNDVDCDIVYVIGNHDEDLYDIKKVWEEKGIKFPYKGKRTFKIFYRTYPERIKGTKIVEGIKIGKNKYVFIHGHQFSKIQFFHWISRGLSRVFRKEIRIDPIDWLQDLANVSYTKKIRMKFGRLTGIFTLFLLFIYIFYYHYLFVESRFNDTLIGSGWGALWVFISFLFLVTVLPVCLTFWFTKIWEGKIWKWNIWELLGFRIKCKPIEDVIKNRYKDEKGKNIDANIIVFGHTHNAGYYPKELKENERLFINTGCWVRECEERKRNTFLYIDPKAATYLLKWDKGEIACCTKKEIIRNS